MRTNAHWIKIIAANHTRQDRTKRKGGGDTRTGGRSGTDGIGGTGGLDRVSYM